MNTDAHCYCNKKAGGLQAARFLLRALPRALYALNYVFGIEFGSGVDFCLLRFISLFTEEGERGFFAIFYAGLVEGVYVEQEGT